MAESRFFNKPMPLSFWEHTETIAIAWKLSKNISNFPHYQSDFPIVGAIRPNPSLCFNVQYCA
jgi:hypothetical protein